MIARLIYLILLLTPAAASATPQFDLTVALQNIRSGRPDDALALLNRAIHARTLAPGDLGDALEWRAFLQAERRNFAAAKLDLDAAVAAQADNPLRRRARARLLLRMGDARGALADIDAAMARSPSDEENYADRCEILLALGRRTEAVDACRRSIRVNPEYARPKNLLRRARIPIPRD